MFDCRGAADRRVCPDCLAEAAYHRAIWDLTFIAVCPVHLKALVDTCAACARPLKWAGGDLTRCTCHRGDLARMATPSISADEARGTKVAYSLLGDARFAAEADHARTLAPFSDLGDGKIVEFLFRIGLELLAPRRKLFSMEQPNELAWEAHLALTRGLGVAEAWHDAFFAVMDDMATRVPDVPSLPPRRSVRAFDRWLEGMGVDEGVAIRAAAADHREGFKERRAASGRDTAEPGVPVGKGDLG